MGQLGKALRMTNFMDWSMRLVTYGWFIGGVVVTAVAILGKFVPFSIGHDEISQWTLVLLGLIIIGIVSEIYRMEKRHAQTIVDVTTRLQGIETQREEQHKTISQSLDNIVAISPVLESVLDLPPDKREDVGRYAKHVTDLMTIRRYTNPSVLQIFDNLYKEQRLSLCALSQGRINVPLHHWPQVNCDIIKTCGNRMDAVSPDGLKFWKTEIGQAYLNQSLTPKGRSQHPVLTRVFILDHQILIPQLGDILEIMKLHLRANIGFAIVLDNFLADLKDKHRIYSDSPVDETAPRLDFALFNNTPDGHSMNNRAVTFFRYDVRGDGPTRGRAVFSQDVPLHDNNRIIQQHRNIWVDLMPEAWLVSQNFRPIIESGLSADERQRVATMSTEENRRLSIKTKLIPEDEWFPFVVTKESELEDKIRSVHEYYERLHF